MPAGPLVHLVEPSAWRAALDDGAVRPRSLDEVGFVHLSTPEQVHLPAAALFPGRRDMVLLVVDPGPAHRRGFRVVGSAWNVLGPDYAGTKSVSSR